MTVRTCVERGCLELTERTRCAGHRRDQQRQRDARRGTARQRGYDADHESRRELLPYAYGQPCPRCGRTMRRGQALDFGHRPGAGRATDSSSRAERIEHASCNRAASAD